MKQQINIISAEQKTAKTGAVYLSLETDKGRMNCFDGATILHIQNEGLGKLCEVETETNNNYTNIVDFYAVVGEATQTPQMNTNDQIGNQWAINSAIKIMELKENHKVTFEEIKEVAISLKKIREEI